METAGLTLISDIPEKDITVMADCRILWRIFENLLNNVCKYALPGTRVYVSLEERGDEAVITFKNTSRDALNISSKDLMERFFEATNHATAALKATAWGLRSQGVLPNFRKAGSSFSQTAIFLKRNCRSRRSDLVKKM